MTFLVPFMGEGEGGGSMFIGEGINKITSGTTSKNIIIIDDLTIVFIFQCLGKIILTFNDI
jgi:hypothetical protein